MSTSKSEKLTLDILKSAVASAAAFRCRRRLQPAGGPGDKVFPPTFAGAVYAVEQRRIPGRADPVTCVVLDTVQSQANRMELALQEALDTDRIKIPVVKVDFSAWSPNGDKPAGEKFIDEVGVITSLQAPHRLADAILRDSQTKDGTPFRDSEHGKALNSVSQRNATALYRLCPTALIFGMWDSTGPKRGLGAKFERAMVSEVVGIGSETGDLLRGVRRDPIEASRNVPVSKTSPMDWQIAKDPKAKGVEAPSAVNHSSVPYPEQRDRKTDKNRFSGVTLEYAEQVTTLSLIVLRRLGFPTGDASSAEANEAGRTVLAALGLTAATLAFESGLALRSRCLIWPEEPMTWELLETPGVEPKKFTLGSAEAVSLLNAAIAAAKIAQLNWLDTGVDLVPQPKLAELIRLSQLEATKEDASDSD